MQDPPGLGHILGLLFDKPVDCGALQVIAQDVELVLRLNSIVQVLCDVHVLFGHSLLAILLVRGDLDLVGAEDLAEGRWLVVEERFAKVVKVGRGKFQEHLKLALFDFLKHVLVVKRLVELGFSLAASDSSPVFRANHRLQEIVVAATVEASEGLEPLRE